MTRCVYEGDLGMIADPELVAWRCFDQVLNGSDGSDSRQQLLHIEFILRNADYYGHAGS